MPEEPQSLQKRDEFRLWLRLLRVSLKGKMVKPEDLLSAVIEEYDKQDA